MVLLYHWDGFFFMLKFNINSRLFWLKGKKFEKRQREAFCVFQQLVQWELGQNVLRGLGEAASAWRRSLRFNKSLFFLWFHYVFLFFCDFFFLSDVQYINEISYYLGLKTPHLADSCQCMTIKFKLNSTSESF